MIKFSSSSLNFAVEMNNRSIKKFNGDGDANAEAAHFRRIDLI